MNSSATHAEPTGWIDDGLEGRGAHSTAAPGSSGLVGWQTPGASTADSTEPAGVAEAVHAAITVTTDDGSSATTECMPSTATLRSAAATEMDGYHVTSVHGSLDAQPDLPSADLVLPRQRPEMVDALAVDRIAFDVAAAALFGGSSAGQVVVETGSDVRDPAQVSRETVTNGAAATESVIPRAAELRHTEVSGADVRGPSAPPLERNAATPAVAPLASPQRTRILTIANQKGGVGKTTTTVNVAAALAAAGLQVLVIDMDPQGNASTALGVDHRAEVPSVYDVVVEERPLDEVIVESPEIGGLWCAPATIDLAGAEIELVPMVARENRLRRAIEELLASGRHFDYVFIDCPPSLGLLTVNAFVAATEVFIPIQCEYYALEGLSQLLKNVEMIKRHLNPELHVSSILMTMYDARTRLSSQVVDEVRAHFPDQVLRTRVPRSVRISEAPSFGQTVISYDPSSSGALSYIEAARELVERG